MKPITCPISSERIPEHLPRLTALWTILLLVGFLLTGFWPLITLVVIDFLCRSLQFERYSFLTALSKKTARLLQLNSAMIDKAPKVFAARLGLVFSIFIHLLYLSGFTYTAGIAALTLISFAALECLLSICIGCYIYSWLIVPFKSK